MSAETTDLIIKIAVPVILGIITTFIIPAITKWIGNMKNSKLSKFISNTVRAAEQIYGPGTAEIKKQYVIDQVKKAFKHIGYSDDLLDTMIEGAVYEVSGAIKQAKDIYNSGTEIVDELKSISANDLTVINDTTNKKKDTSESTGIKVS